MKNHEYNCIMYILLSKIICKAYQFINKIDDSQLQINSPIQDDSDWPLIFHWTARSTEVFLQGAGFLGYLECGGGRQKRWSEEDVSAVAG